MTRRLLYFLGVFGFFLLAVPQPVGAFDPYGGVSCSGSASSTAVCQTQKNPSNPLSGSQSLFINIANIIAYVAGAAAIIVIIVSAIQFVTSGSDTSKGGRVDDDVVNARRALVSALIGLAIIVLARILIIYIVKRA